MKRIITLVTIGLVLAGCRQSVPQRPSQPQQPAPQPAITTTQQQPMQNQEGLSIQISKQGTGPEAKNGDTVSVHYTGTLVDGTKFDSSVDRGTPFSFKLGAGRVIKGWDLGVVGMKVGEKRTLTIQPDLGYGSSGIGPIPPNAVLVFDVEMIAIR